TVVRDVTLLNFCGTWPTSSSGSYVHEEGCHTRHCSSSSRPASFYSPGGPNARRAPATTVRPNNALPAPPIPAPIPNGTRRPITRSPCLVPYFVTNQRPRTLLTLVMVDIGIASVSSLPQCFPVRPAAFSTKLAP